MKLRTRLTLMSGAVIFLALLISDALIFRICQTTILNQAVEAGFQESQAVFQGFSEYGARFQGEISESMAEFYLKSRQDDYTILQKDGRVVYNQTILDPERLLAESMDCSMRGIHYCRYFYGGRRLLVFPMESTFGFEGCHVCDITEVYFTIYSVAWAIAAISAVILGAASLGLLLVLRRALRPLGALSDGANSMAAGAYDQRVPEGRGDEIGRLGRDFNKMAQAVEEHIRQVEDSEEKKTLFIGSLTHELKTPLTAISGYAQTLRLAKLSEEDRDTALSYIYQESQRLDRLAKKMLRLLELDRETELALEPVETAAVMETAYRACLPLAQAKGVELRLGACTGVLLADADLMAEVVVNLIDNGIKASAPGGKVLLYAGEEGIVVEDNGRGIPPEELDRLTEPFYMVDKSRSRKSGGAGLGLALAAAILRKHHMDLRIESQPDRGTRVTVVFKALGLV